MPGTSSHPTPGNPRDACKATPTECLRSHVGPRLGNGAPQLASPWQWSADCPVCGAPGKLSIVPGTKGPSPPRLVWRCQARKCDPADIRRRLLVLVSSACLGRYDPKPQPAKAADPAAELASARRCQLDAIDAVLADQGIRAMADLRLRIAECLRGEAPKEWGAFLAFAERAGVQRSKRYPAAARWGRRK